jgi:hypothetical protein
VGKQEILGGIKEMQYLLIATVVVLKKLSGATQNKFHSLGLSLAHFKATCEENTFESYIQPVQTPLKAYTPCLHVPDPRNFAKLSFSI